MAGHIQTVAGPIDPSRVGITLTHEHFLHRAEPSMFSPRPIDPRFRHICEEKVKTETLWFTTHHPWSQVDNLVMIEDEVGPVIIDEMKFYRENGGQTIVEVTTFGKDVQFMKKVVEETGVNVVSGTGYYVGHGMTDSIRAQTQEQIYGVMNKELFEGVEGAEGIKCGVIGEIGTVWPLEDFEKRGLRAAAAVQSDNKTVPVIIHPGRNPEAPFEIMRIFLEAGGRPEKTVMSHLERTLLNDEQLLEFAKIGNICEFDLFGSECSYYDLAENIDFPSDAIRIKRLKTLIDNGFGKQITIAQDIHTKHRLMKYGGHGFSHILLNAVPKMRQRGYSEENIQDILVNTPRDWLTIKND